MRKGSKHPVSGGYLSAPALSAEIISLSSFIVLESWMQTNTKVVQLSSAVIPLSLPSSQSACLHLFLSTPFCVLPGHLAFYWQQERETGTLYQYKPTERDAHKSFLKKAPTPTLRDFTSIVAEVWKQPRVSRQFP